VNQHQMKIHAAQIGAGIGWVFAMMYPQEALRSAVVFAGLMVAIDCITGVFKSWWLGEPITSRKLIRSAFKAVVYLTLPAVVLWAMVHTGAGWASAATATILVSALIGVEALSILENLRKAEIIKSRAIIKFLEGRFKDAANAIDPKEEKTS